MQIKLSVQGRILGFIILIAFLARVFIIWVGRPEFIGWFNHTYYYFVQVKGILTNGNLAFDDMPFLFYLYALTAKLLMIFGMDLNAAVVDGSRFWMCLIPALIPVPVYYFLKNNLKIDQLKWQHWLLIAASGFLPLSLTHLTETSQKNMLGMLLLAILFYQVFLFLKNRSNQRFYALAGTLFIIILSHFGTAIVSLIFGCSLLLSYFILNKEEKKSSRILMWGIPFIAIALISFYFMDEERFYRIFFYLSEGWKSSFLGAIFLKDLDGNGLVFNLLGILIPACLTLLFYRIFKSIKERMPHEEQIFFLGMILFFYFLLLPFYDQLLFARFALFESIVVLIILIFILKYSHWKQWLKNAIAISSFGICLLLAIGEGTSLKIFQGRNEAIFEDLLSLKNSVPLSENDLILTKNGAEHISNWFLHTKSALITSFKKSDFKNYQNIYILNPIEGSLNFEGIEGKTTSNEKDKYLFMMRNIPIPENAQSVFESDLMTLHKISNAPTEWLYDEDGNWMGYGE
ncbi:MAG: hypothetical protein R2879_07675 [Saprospiraceae bacterium]